jgi:SAM-dependent methyltransferase
MNSKKGIIDNMVNNWKAFLKSLVTYRISSKTKFNFYYFLYCLYELRYGKILMHNGGYFPSNLTNENAYQLQLYLELMAAGEISQTEALNVCDIGCGQGHGTVFLLQNYLNSQSHVTGLETSEIAIGYCKWKYRKLKNAVFKFNRQGIPFSGEAFDVILSVGSGIPHSSKLLQEIYRCLKPSGVFIFYEVYETAKEYVFDQQISRNGFAIVKKNNVTVNLVQSLIRDNDRKQAQLAKLWFLPKKVVAFLDSYATTVGSAEFDNCQSNKRSGFIYALCKLPDFQLPELIKGYIDLWDGQYLKGWAFFAKQNQPIKLHIILNGKIIAETIADLPRQDVADVHGAEKINCGFSVALPLPDVGSSYTVQVAETSTGQKICSTPFVITG